MRIITKQKLMFRIKELGLKHTTQGTGEPETIPDWCERDPFFKMHRDAGTLECFGFGKNFGGLTPSITFDDPRDHLISPDERVGLGLDEESDGTGSAADAEIDEEAKAEAAKAEAKAVEKAKADAAKADAKAKAAAAAKAKAKAKSKKDDTELEGI